MRWKKCGALFITVCSILFFGTALHAQSPQELTVSAAISLKNAFDEIGKPLRRSTVAQKSGLTSAHQETLKSR